MCAPGLNLICGRFGTPRRPGPGLLRGRRVRRMAACCARAGARAATKGQASIGLAHRMITLTLTLQSHLKSYGIIGWACSAPFLIPTERPRYAQHNACALRSTYVVGITRAVCYTALIMVLSPRTDSTQCDSDPQNGLKATPSHSTCQAWSMTVARKRFPPV